MKYLLALLLLTGCRATDLEPDTFNVEFGQGNTEGDLGKRDIDADSQWFSFGWGWKLGDKADRQEYADREARYLEALQALQPAKAPEPVAVPAQPSATVEPPAPKPEPKDEKVPLVIALIPTLTTIALGVLGAMNRMGKTNVLSPKHHE